MASGRPISRAMGAGRHLHPLLPHPRARSTAAPRRWPAAASRKRSLVSVSSPPLMSRPSRHRRRVWQRQRQGNELGAHSWAIPSSAVDAAGVPLLQGCRGGITGDGAVPPELSAEKASPISLPSPAGFLGRTRVPDRLSNRTGPPTPPTPDSSPTATLPTSCRLADTPSLRAGRGTPSRGGPARVLLFRAMGMAAQHLDSDRGGGASNQTHPVARTAPPMMPFLI